MAVAELASCVLVMANTVAAGLTVTVAAAVAPTAVAVIVAVPTPAATPETTVENWPLLSVVPELVLRLTTPVPLVATVIDAPDSGAPIALFAMNVMVTGDVPSSGTLRPLPDTTDKVEPAMRIGIWAVTEPAVAVIVAVRLATVDVPE